MSSSWGSDRLAVALARQKPSVSSVHSPSQDNALPVADVMQGDAPHTLVASMLLALPLAWRISAIAVPVVCARPTGIPRDSGGSSSVQGTPSGPFRGSVTSG